MNNQGEVNPGALLELFQELGASNKIFQLDFAREDGRKTQLIYKDGNLIYVPLEGHKGLEIFLIGEGAMSAEQVEELVKYKNESGLPLEQIIVQADILSEEQLKKVWQTIAKDFVLDLFTSESGQFTTKELATHEGENQAFCALSNLGECEGEIHQMIGCVTSLGGFNSIYKIPSGGYLSNIENISEECKKQLQSTIDGKNTVTDIINWSFFTVSKTLKILNDLKNKKSIELVVANDDGAKADAIIEKEKALEEVPNVELSTDTPLPTKGNFSGSFSVLSLVEVMQTLNSARRTGVLNLDLKNGPAVLNIQNGELVSATYGELKNKDAFYALVTLEDGEFYFESNQGGFAKEMEIPTMSLLMEALRLTDEGSKQSVDDILGDSFEERPMAARVIKKTESKTSRIIKILVLVGVVVFPLVYFFIYIPSQEKEVEFTEQKTKVEISINTHQYLSAIDSWKKFLAAHKDKHPDWEESVNQEIEVIEIKQKEAMDLVKKNTEIAVKKKDFTKALENISANESVIANGGGNVQKDFMKQRDLIIKQQKEQDYIAWKSTSEINFNKAKDLVADFDHDKAIDLIKPIEENLDKVKEKELYDKVYELNKLISEREKVIKLSQFIVSDKNSTYPNKIEAYEKIILNAGIKQPRGLQANKELAIAKEKMSSFETKLKGILLSHAKDTAAVRVEVIEKLQKDVSSVEEFQFLDKEKEKILEANGESRKLLLNFQELVVKKEYKNAFLIGKKLIDQYSESEATSAVKLPFHVETNTGLILKVDGVQVELPFNGFIPFNQIVKIQADKKGCNSISLEIDKNLKNYEIELNFKKSEVWSFEYKGNLDTLPLICLNGKAVVLNNHTDLEMIYLDSGNKAWSRQINNPAVPYKKSNGTTITVGDDDFWKLDSPLCLFENYIGICSKNAETYVLSCEGGNNIVRHEMNFLSKSAPFIVRLPLLGNKAFAYTGTADGILFCVALDDQSVRFQEKLGDANNGILGVFPLNENFFVAVLEQGVQCFSLSTSKVKWSKPFVSKIKEVYSIGGKIFARQQDGLLEITDNPDTWKLIPFQLREIKDVVFNGNDFGIVGGGKTFYLDYPNGRFSLVNAPVSEKPIFVSAGKYYLQSENSVQCFDAKSQKMQWETNIAPLAIKKIRLVGNYMFIIDGSRLHAFLIE